MTKWLIVEAIWKTRGLDLDAPPRFELVCVCLCTVSNIIYASRIHTQYKHMHTHSHSHSLADVHSQCFSLSLFPHRALIVAYLICHRRESMLGVCVCVAGLLVMRKTYIALFIRSYLWFKHVVYAWRKITILALVPISIYMHMLHGSLYLGYLDKDFRKIKRGRAREREGERVFSSILQALLHLYTNTDVSVDLVLDFIVTFLLGSMSLINVDLFHISLPPSLSLSPSPTISFVVAGN